MRRLSRRCPKQGCREWIPCKVHPVSNWENNQSPPLPSNWGQLKRRYAHWKAQGCALCGAKGVPLEFDHRTPRSKGGSDAPANLQWVCRPCHNRKTRADKKL